MYNRRFGSVPYAASVGAPGEPDITLFAPFGAPAVLDDPVRVPSDRFSAIANH